MRAQVLHDSSSFFCRRIAVRHEPCLGEFTESLTYRTAALAAARTNDGQARRRVRVPNRGSRSHHAWLASPPKAPGRHGDSSQAPISIGGPRTNILSLVKAINMTATGSRRPNIVYFHTHDTGRMIDPYGFAMGTPNLAGFARTGTLFRNAFSAAPTCSPSRAALLTGQCPHSSGMLGLAHRGFSLTDPSQHIATTLGEVGYTSAMVGIQHLVNGPDEAQTLGYDELLTTDDRRANAVAAAASDYIHRRHREPFFLSIGLFETHIFPSHDEYLFGYPPVNEGYVPRPQTLPDTPETRRDIAAFVSAVREVDTALGTCLEALERAGVAENTIVIVTTDHGAPLPGMKCTLTDFGTGVMLLIRGPGDRSAITSSLRSMSSPPFANSSGSNPGPGSKEAHSCPRFDKASM